MAVNLANIERLDASAVEALEKYVAAGGGVVFFLGERSGSRSTSTTCCIATARGCFPCRWPARPNCRSIVWSRPPTSRSATHFIFRVFAAKRNTFLQTVAVQRYFAVPEGWRPPPDSTVRVAARLRNGAPLVVERQFRQGPRRGLSDHRRPGVEQLGPQSELRRRPPGLAGVSVAAAGREAVAAGRLAAGIAPGSGGLPAAGSLHLAGSRRGGHQRPSTRCSPPTAR